MTFLAPIFLLIMSVISLFSKGADRLPANLFSALSCFCFLAPLQNTGQYYFVLQAVSDMLTCLFLYAITAARCSKLAEALIAISLCAAFWDFIGWVRYCSLNDVTVYNTGYLVIYCAITVAMLTIKTDGNRRYNRHIYNNHLRNNKNYCEDKK